ncbi:MAG: energy transducer TonB, partial [Magnetospirillum sp.]
PSPAIVAPSSVVMDVFLLPPEPETVVSPPPPEPPPPVPQPPKAKPVVSSPPRPKPVVQPKPSTLVADSAPAVLPVSASPPTAPALAAAIPVAPKVVTAAAISCPTPRYPSRSRYERETGLVVVRLRVDANGRVVEHRLAESSGFSRLDDATLVAMANCVFTPGSVDGQAQTSWITLRYVWRLQ